MCQRNEGRHREKNIKMETDCLGTKTTFTCMPMMAQMKNSMAMSKQTYGRACKTNLTCFGSNKSKNSVQKKKNKKKNKGSQYHANGVKDMADLEGLDKGPEQNADGVALTQKFNQPSCSEQLKKAHTKRLKNQSEHRGDAYANKYWRQNRI